MLSSIIETYKLPTNLTKSTQELFSPSTIKYTEFKSPKEHVDVLYMDNDQIPVWFSSRAGKLVPTVYTLWRAPFLLEKVYTNPHVIEVLIGGANLMLPGCAPSFGTIQKGDVVGICDTAHPNRVMAIGYAALDLKDITKTVGTTGIAVNVIHRVDDVICHVAKKKVEVPEQVEEVTMVLKEEEEEEEEEKGEEETDVQAKEEDSNQSTHGDDRSEDVTTDQVEKLTKELNDLTTDDVDYLLKRALYQTLTQTPVTPPLSSSQFMDQLVQNLATDHSDVNIKKSSWKKAAKFLKAMEKDGFLKLKGKGDDLTVVEVAKSSNNDTLKGFVPYKVKKPAKKSPSESSSNGKAAGSLILEHYYKPTSVLRPLYNSLDLELDAYYTTKELRKHLDQYIDKEQLVNPADKSTIIVNDFLSKIIPGNKNLVKRSQLLAPFEKQFSSFYTISKPGQSNGSLKKLRGTPPKVHIVIETKIGRKTITRVFNFETYGVDAEELSAELKLKCSGSATIRPNVQSPKIIEVVVQGSHSQKAVELLTTKFGLNPNWIDSEDKSKKSKKKK